MSNRSSRAQNNSIQHPLLSLKEVAELLGPHCSVPALRAEVHAGRLRCVRLRPGPNSKILISQQALADWLDEYAGRRQLVNGPRIANPTRTQSNP